MNTKLPTFEDVTQAADRLAGHANPTPLLRHTLLDKISGQSLYIKNETAQKSGAFKYRGAYSRLSLLNADARKAGVVAFSSGNHAQGVALAAKELGMSATIVMPNTAPQAKKQGTLSHGAKIVEYDPVTTKREELGAQIARDEGRTLVKPFDDRFVIAGQGTCGLEILQQANGMSVSLDALITPMGGGGLCAGINLAVRALSPKTKTYGAEPIGYDDHARSLAAGKRISNTAAPLSLCDALMSPAPGEITFAINKTHLSGVFVMSDDACLLAMAVAQETLGVTLEPGGAIALAAILSRRTTIPLGSNVAIVLSGGNVDPATTALAHERAQQFG